MRIPEYTFRNVVFLVDGGQPRATAFFVGVPEPEYRILVPYVVTARHCIEETAGRQFLVRINVGDRYHEEESVMDDWWLHDSEDVAVIRFEAGTSSPQYDVRLESVEKFIDADYHFNASQAMAEASSAPGFAGSLSGRFTQGEFEHMDRAPVEIGHEVFFVSLLYEQPGEQRNLPIARFGNISRMPEEPILMRRTGGTIAELTAYLVECHSWGGHSGSPVYWTHPITVIREIQGPEGETIYLPQTANVGALLGLVSGHWDIEQEAVTEGDVVGSIRTAINSGIAVVTPASFIRDLLMREDVVADRKAIAKSRQEELDARRAMTPDSAPGESEFERFEDLTRKLVNPKKEVDERRKGHGGK